MARKILERAFRDKGAGFICVLTVAPQVGTEQGERYQYGFCFMLYGGSCTYVIFFFVECSYFMIIIIFNATVLMHGHGFRL